MVFKYETSISYFTGYPGVVKGNIEGDKHLKKGMWI